MPTDNTLIGREYYVFRDSIHNLIFIEDPKLGTLFRSLLDTYEFQRLRRIKQNGLGAFVYSSLEGTRFPHSLGSFFVAKRVVEALREQLPGPEFGFPKALGIEPPDEHGFAIAASLHDIGHAPLSHTWEIVDEALAEVIPGHLRHDHEAAGLKLLGSDNTEIGSLFAEIMADKDAYASARLASALQFLRKQHTLGYLRPLLSGNLDIDRLDFIARDTKNAGVTYGSHDVEWLIRSMRFGRLPALPDQIPPSSWVIAIDARKGLNALIQYLRARENMYGLVYLHKTVRAANWQLASIFAYTAVLLGKGVVKHNEIPLLRYLAGADPDDAILQLDDTDVWYTLRHLTKTESPFLSTSAKRFLSRKFYKSRQVSLETARIMEKVIGSPAFADRLRVRLNRSYPELFDRSVVSADAASRIVARVDTASVDIIGKDKDVRDETWIMYRRPTDLGLLPLKDYWKRTIDEETTKHYAFVHYLKEVEPDIVELVTRLESVFPQISADGPTKSPDGSGKKDGDRPNPPEGFELQRSLSDDGAHKEAYLAVFTGHDAQGSFSCGEPYVLKRYRKLSEETSAILADCIDTIFGIKSPHLSRAVTRRGPEGRPLWLIEPLWIADLLKLIEETGIRRNPLFLLQMGADLASGLAGLAAKNIRHGDIKLENCGIVAGTPDRSSFVLGDFGAATAEPNKVPPTETGLGTLKTRPPELLVAPDARQIGLGSDVWALAATVYAAATGSYPFMPLKYDRDERPEIERDLLATLPERREKLQRDVANRLPPVLAKILGPCLLRDLDKRPSASDLSVQFHGAVAKCKAPANIGKSVSSTGPNELYWQRAIDLVDLDQYARNVGLHNNTLNMEESADILSKGKSWIPKELARRLLEISDRK